MFDFNASADVLSGSGAFPLLICPMIILISPIVGEVTTMGMSMGAALMSGGFTGAGLFNKSSQCPAHLSRCFRIPLDNNTKIQNVFVNREPYLNWKESNPSISIPFPSSRSITAAPSVTTMSVISNSEVQNVDAFFICCK
ncbi:unnamed protein product [Schistosoma mattheei]|uniref:Uncharacterized protein n=1 Tax=Schistosoma mattheei TaxID=31246 RepID=A0A183NZS8_9TREM|nr:unnamed protein product [Schistosoma mattheei]